MNSTPARYWGAFTGAMGSSNPQFGYATSIAIVILLLSFILSIVQIRLGRRAELEE